jgi:hypothetical protein
MTLPAAKELIATYLRDHALSYSRLTASAITNAEAVSVTIHGWPMIPCDLGLNSFGREHGIRVEYERRSGR